MATRAIGYAQGMAFLRRVKRTPAEVMRASVRK